MSLEGIEVNVPNEVEERGRSPYRSMPLTMTRYRRHSASIRLMPRCRAISAKTHSSRLRFGEDFAQASKEKAIVLLFPENISSLYSTGDDVIKKSFRLEAWFYWQVQTLCMVGR